MFIRNSLVGLISAAAVLTSRPVFAQTAQGEIVVPQFSVFAVNTTVSAPDRGGTSMGGVGRGAEFRNEFQPGLGRGFSSNRSASGADARVWIMDFDEMERGMAGRMAERGPPSRDFAGALRRYAATRPQPEKSDGKVAASKSEKSPPDDAALSKEAHAADLLKRGQDAESRGKLTVAALFYKSVVSLNVASSAKVAQERLRGLEPKVVGR